MYIPSAYSQQILSLLRLFEVAAEGVAHGGEELVGVFGLAARTEAFIEGRTEDGGGDRFVDGGGDGPATLAGVGDAALEFREVGVFQQGLGREVEQPGGNDAAAPPEFGDIGDIEAVLVILRVAQRGRFGIDELLVQADIGVVQDIQPFGVGGHDAILDAVVNHLHEVAGAMRATAQVAVLGRAGYPVSTGSGGRALFTGGQSGKYRVEILHRLLFPADHQAVAAFKSPDAAAGADIEIVNALRLQLGRAADIIDIVGIAAIDDDISLIDQRQKLGQGGINRGGRDHHPENTRLRQLIHQVLQD